jgi:hypothetical protein
VPIGLSPLDCLDTRHELGKFSLHPVEIVMNGLNLARGDIGLGENKPRPRRSAT